MPINADGTATCDRCRTDVPGYGVLYGLVSTDLDSTGGTVRRLFCYYHHCRDAALGDLINHQQSPDAPLACAACQVPLSGVSDAMLCSDIDGDVVRSFAFCYVNGHRNQLLTQAYGWTPPLIPVDVFATTWWNRPEETITIGEDVSTNWNVASTATISTITREISTTWNDLALSLITLLQTHSEYGINTDWITLVLDTRPSVGDYLLAAYTATAGDWVVGPGWEEIGSATQSGVSTHVFGHFYEQWEQDSNITAWSWNLNTATTWGGTVLAFSGVDPAVPVDAATSPQAVTSATSTFTGDPLTPTTNNSLLLGVLGLNTTSTSVGVTPPSGWTLDTAMNSGATSGKAQTVAHLNGASAGTYTTSWRTTSSRTGNLLLFALRSTSQALALHVTSGRGTTWNLNSALVTVTGSRGSTWTTRAAPVSTRLTTWNALATAPAGITTRTALAADSGGVTSTSLTMPKPVDAVAGDVMVASFSTNGAAVTSSGVPTGWTLASSSTSLSNPKVYAYYRRLTSADDTVTSYTWTLASAVSWGGNAQAFAGVDPTNPMDVPAVAVTESLSTATTFTISTQTQTNGAMAVCTLGANTGSSVNATEPSGWTRDGAAPGPSPFTAHKANALAHVLVPTADAIAATWTISSGRAGALILAILRPAASGSTPPPSSGGIVARTATSASVPGGGTNTSVVITKPTNAVTGDFLVASFTVGGTVSVAGEPAGWTLNSLAELSGANTYLYVRRLAAGDPTSWTWTLSAATSWGANMQAFGGVSTATPTVGQNSATYSATNTTSYPLTLSATGTNMTIVTTLGVNASGTTALVTQPEGFTLDTAVNSGFTSTKGNAMAHGTQASAGTATYTWLTDGRAGTVAAVALLPA